MAVAGEVGTEGGVVAGRYRLTKLLARGGMGEVHAAVDETTGRAVALKRMLPEVARRASLSASFMSEYHVLSELRHPRIIEVFDYGVDAGVPYYTMELLDGQDLRELAPLPPALACMYLRDVASSLALLHARRLLHRDLSPRNVRRTSDGRCKLIDFGTMVPFGAPPNLAGTPPLVPPEALRGAALDQRSDLYAFGALAYYLLTGKHGYPVKEFDALPRAHREPLRRPRRLVPEIPQALDDLVMSLMALDPTQRPRSAAEVIDLLNAIGQLPADDTPGVALSFLTSAHLVGRSVEQNKLKQRLERAHAGQGSTLLLYGAPGTGRTRLLEETARRAQTLGFVTVQAVARGQRGTETLASQLVQALQRCAPEETRVTMRSGDSMAPTLTAANGGGSPTGEAGARLQTSLTRLFREVAQQRPLLLAIDDVDRADDFSVAFIAALAHDARKLPLLIVATRTTGQAEDALFTPLGALRKSAGTLTLRDLDEPSTAELVSSLFGEVPNVQRVSAWLYRVAHGNPALTLELAEHLIARGVVRYVEGTWLLPSDDIAEAVPADLTQTLGLRLLRLQPTARALAELISVRRGGLALPLALAASKLEQSVLITALDELTRNGIVEGAGQDFVFTQRAMREAVSRSLTPQREAELHEQLAGAMLVDAEASDDTRLEAGWHLVHTRAELKGADLLAEVGPRLVREGLSVATAIPAIEKALTVYELRGRPLAERLRLRAVLVLSGYLFDYRLGLRYGEDTFATLYERSGLALTDRLHRILPGRLALVCAMVITTVSNLFVRKRDRAPNVVAALQYFGRAAMGLMGLRATALDGPGTAYLHTHARGLGHMPLPIAGAVVELAAKAFALQPLGREVELHEAVTAAIATMIDRCPLLMHESERQELLTGLLLIDGINECYRERSRALERATRLDALGTQLAAACAKRVRMTYHTVRGAREAADRERKELDLLAIQGGTTWQVEWFSAPIEGLAGAIIGDLLATRRALEKLETLVGYVPSLQPLRDSVRIGYHYRRGEHTRVAELGEAYVAKHAPRTIIGWGPTYAIIALSMCECGQAARALEITTRATSILDDNDHAYFVMYAPLVVAHAAAYAMLGDLERSDQIFGACTARLATAGEHAALAILHDKRARLARLRGDNKRFHDAVSQMRRAALAGSNMALIAMADQWADIFARTTHNSVPPAPYTIDIAEQSAAASNARTQRRDHGQPEELTAVTTFLLRTSGPERSRNVLDMLAQATATTCGYLYTCHGTKLALAASLTEDDEPELLESRIAALLARHPGAGQYLLDLRDPDAAGDAEAATRYHVIMLADPQARSQHIAVAALRKPSDDGFERVRPALLDEVSAVLVAD